MIIIATVSDKYFTLNGVQYAKIYQPLKQGVSAIGIYNTKDTRQQLISSTLFSDYEIDGVTYGTQEETIAALLPVIYLEDAVFQEFNTITNNITNNPDEEDITDTGTELKFKDRDSNIANKKLGYKIIRSDFDWSAIPPSYADCIWELRYDYNLSGTVTIPANVTLKFVGGSLRNYTSLVGNNTRVEADKRPIFFHTFLNGTWDAEFVPEWFGASGNGIDDDSSKCQKALDLTKRPIVWEGEYYCASGLKISESGKLISKLKLKNCSLYLNATSNILRDVVVKGVIITEDVLTTDKNGIIVDVDAAYSIRNCIISECTFYNHDKAIYMPPTGNAFHNRGTLIITNNIFQSCNYSVFGDVEESLKDANCINDIHISDNIMYSFIKDIYFKSADGCVIVNNTMFGNGGDKENGIHIADGLTDQVKISGNQIFETQKEGILIERVKQYQINDNNIVATVSLDFITSKIKCTTVATPAPCIITNNVIRSATKHGIEVLGTGANIYTVNVANNVIYIKNSGIVEGTDLSTIAHYGVYAEGSFMYVQGENQIIAADNTEYLSINGTTNNLISSGLTKTPTKRAFIKTINLDAASKELFTTNGTNATLMILIKATYGSGNNASYLLLVGNNAGGDSLVLVSEAGLVGATAPNNHPSFNWSSVSGSIQFTHKNSSPITNLDYTFDVVILGTTKLI